MLAAATVEMKAAKMEMKLAESRKKLHQLRLITKITSFRIKPRMIFKSNVMK